jgi:hypothetical protein
MTNKKEGNRVETSPSHPVCNYTFTRFVQY